ncbi:proline utilization trans-activator [Microdochium nivale]|nr:proline utilization trans-activator [Microdochium nivale]
MPPKSDPPYPMRQVDTAQSARVSASPDEDLPLSHEESTMLNPLFDYSQARGPIDRQALYMGNSDFIGEVFCSAFSDRLLQCFDDTCTPAKTGFSNCHRRRPRRASSEADDTFPERMHAKLLQNLARRFIGNYNPLFLDVTFMRKMDAVYRREMTPTSLWLCKFYALMALDEIYSNRRGADNSGLVPGTRYFERAVDTFSANDIYEEPCLMHVEILTLLLIMKPAAATSEALETLLSILRSIKKDGNIPAVDFCDRLSQVQDRVFSLRGKMQHQRQQQKEQHVPS